jgi:hypothetical protein
MPESPAHPMHRKAAEKACEQESSTKGDVVGAVTRRDRRDYVDENVESPAGQLQRPESKRSYSQWTVQVTQILARVAQLAMSVRRKKCTIRRISSVCLSLNTVMGCRLTRKHQFLTLWKRNGIDITQPGVHCAFSFHDRNFHRLCDGARNCGRYLV